MRGCHRRMRSFDFAGVYNGVEMCVSTSGAKLCVAARRVELLAAVVDCSVLSSRGAVRRTNGSKVLRVLWVE